MDGMGSLARPLHGPADRDPLMERIGDARIAAIGEAGHGTYECYPWWAALTRRLIEERGFGVVAVEGDWPDCWRLARLLPGEPRRAAPAGAPTRIPRAAREASASTWMWANDVVVDFCCCTGAPTPSSWGAVATGAA